MKTFLTIGIVAAIIAAAVFFFRKDPKELKKEILHPENEDYDISRVEQPFVSLKKRFRRHNHA